MADGADGERRDDLTIDGDVFVVLVNAEGQHSLWPAAKAVPEGWSTVHPAASKADCLAYVETHWTDMRPVSLREAMARDAAMRGEPPHAG
jgi:MbtH protein